MAPHSAYKLCTNTAESEEVIRHDFAFDPLLVLRLVKDKHFVVAALINLHYHGVVAAAVAVVRTAEEGHAALIVLPVVALLGDLVPAGDALEPIRVVELLRDVLAEGVTGPAKVATPALWIRITRVVSGVGPKQIAKETGLRGLLHSVSLVDLADLRDGR